jgi:hypothetical protein
VKILGQTSETSSEEARMGRRVEPELCLSRKLLLLVMLLGMSCRGAYDGRATKFAAREFSPPDQAGRVRKVCLLTNLRDRRLSGGR